MTDQSRRREVLKTGAAAGILLLKPATVFGSQANSALELGIIGSGSRGKFITGLFIEHVGARIVAVADAFPDRLDEITKKFPTQSPRRYVGRQAYQELVNSKLDAVAIETPPYFHPEHAAAAVAAGKHVYLAKPVAVDVPGCRSIMASGEKAKGKTVFWVDWQLRARPVVQEAMARVHRGDIGKLVLGHIYYHGGRLSGQALKGLTGDSARLRRWVLDKVLSGDIIVEQNIHIIDLMVWCAQAHPIQAYGSGGLEARTDIGNTWDHFLVNYTFPNRVKADFSGAQFTIGYIDKCVRFYGTSGTVDAHLGGVCNITGTKPFPGTGTEKDDTHGKGTVDNIKTFAESVRSGRLVNNAEPSAISTLTAILGRTAAYRQRVVTWDEMMRENEKLEATLRI
ncbi:MAG: Gfo/Idh/MocA family oxidoreductase [Acidobacteria bacterium]|nr:Gfo/Idh/MocA family oxidoreductase [Acidobacteriota bacterium]MCL5744969.1 Gfo/Idh/MocA family oxidoreductase [Acidobacteriota bacterium]